MSHVASHYEQPNYLTDVEEIAELSEMKEDILNRVSSAITQVCMCVITTSPSYVGGRIRCHMELCRAIGQPAM